MLEEPAAEPQRARVLTDMQVVLCFLVLAAILVLVFTLPAR